MRTIFENIVANFCNRIAYSSEVKPEQFQKAFDPRLVTELGIVTEVKSVQFQKAYAPMLVTELGIVMEVKLEQE